MSNVVGRVAIRVWPDTRNFRNELRAKLRAMGDPEQRVVIHGDIDTSEINRKKDKLLKDLAKSGFDLKPELRDLDSRSLRKVRDSLKDALGDGADTLPISTKLEDSDLRRMLGQVEDLMRDGSHAGVNDGLDDAMSGAGEKLDRELSKGDRARTKKALTDTAKAAWSDRSIWDALAGEIAMVAWKAQKSAKRGILNPDDGDRIERMAMKMADFVSHSERLRAMTRMGGSFATHMGVAARGVGDLTVQLGHAAQASERFKSASRNLGDGFARLSGLRLMRNTARTILEPAKNFDIIIPKLAVFSTLANQGAVMVGSLSSNLLTLGADLARIGGVGLAAPGVLMSMAVAGAALIVPLTKLKDNLPGVSKAFEESFSWLTTGFYRTNAQQLDTELTKIATTLSGPLHNAGRAAGAWLGDFAEQFNKIVGPHVPAMFQGVVNGFRALGEGNDGLATSLKNFGLIGADVFPRMNAWIAETLDNLGEWSTVNYDNILDWIDDGWNSLKDLGTVLVETVRLFDGLADAAELAGGAGLKQLGDRIRDYADIVKSPDVQLGLANVFKAAHDAMGAFLDGLKPGLGSFLDMVSRIADDVAPKLSGVLGGALGALLEGLSSPAVANGVVGFADALGEVGDKLAPVLKMSGETVGILEGINIALPALADLIGGVAGGLLSMLDTLGPAIGIVVTNLSTGLGGALTALTTPLTGLIDTVGVLAISLSEKLGGALQDMAPALGSLGDTIAGGLRAVMPAIEDIFDSISDLAPALATIFDAVGPVVVGAIEVVATGIAGAVDVIASLFEGLADGLGTSGIEIGLIFDAMGGAAEVVAATIGTAFDVVGTIVGESIQFLTGAFEALSQMLKGDFAGASQTMVEAWTVDLDGLVSRTQEKWTGVFNNMAADAAKYSGQAGAESVASLEQTIGAYEIPDKKIAIRGDASDFKVAVSDVEQAIKDLQVSSTKNTQNVLTGLVGAFEDAAPALKEYWTAIYGGGAEGEAAAQTNFDKVKGWVGDVKALVEESGLDVSKYEGDYTAALQAVYDSGGKYSVEAQALLDESIALMQEMGLMPKEIAENLETSATGITDGAKGEMAAFSEYVGGEFRDSLATGVQGSIEPLNTELNTFRDLMSQGIPPMAAPDGGWFTGLPEDIDSSKIGIDELTGKVTSMPPLSYAEGYGPEGGSLNEIVTTTTTAVQALAEQINSLPPLPAPPSTGEGSYAGAFASAGAELDTFVPKVDLFKDGVTTGMETGIMTTGELVDTINGAAGSVTNLGDTMRVTPGLPNTGVNDAKLLGDTVDDTAGRVGDFGVKVSDTSWSVTLIQAMSLSQVAATVMADAAGTTAAKWSAQMNVISVSTVTSRGVVVTAFQGMQAGIAAAVGAASGQMQAFAANTASAVGQARGVVTALPGSIRSAFGGAGSLLVGAGSSIVGGLIRGMRSRLGELKSLLGQITAMIPANKGPIDVDRKLLTPAGEAIGGSLIQGLKNSVDADLLPYLNDLTERIGSYRKTPTSSAHLGGEDSDFDALGTGAKAPVTINNHYPSPENTTTATRKGLELATLHLGF